MNSMCSGCGRMKIVQPAWHNTNRSAITKETFFLYVQVLAAGPTKKPPLLCKDCFIGAISVLQRELVNFPENGKPKIDHAASGPQQPEPPKAG